MSQVRRRGDGIPPGRYNPEASVVHGSTSLLRSVRCASPLQPQRKCSSTSHCLGDLGDGGEHSLGRMPRSQLAAYNVARLAEEEMGKACGLLGCGKTAVEVVAWLVCGLRREQQGRGKGSDSHRLQSRDEDWEL